MTKKDIDKAKRNTGKWLELPFTKRDMYDQPRNAIVERMANSVQNDLRIYPGVFTNMGHISNWLGMRGVNRLLNADLAGWEDIHASFLYRAWNMRINGGYQDANYSKAVFEVWEIALGFVHAIAIREDAFAEWQGSRLLDSLSGNHSKYRGWDDRPFEVFAVKLYGMLRGKADAVNSYLSSGIYQEVLDGWQSPQLVRTLADACENHWRESSDGDGHVGTFAWAPYGMFPVDILAIRRVREDLGLPMPEIDHPLMMTPLANPPQKMPDIHDDVLDQVIAKARAEGVVGIPW